MPRQAKQTKQSEEKEEKHTEINVSNKSPLPKNPLFNFNHHINKFKVSFTKEESKLYIEEVKTLIYKLIDKKYVVKEIKTQADRDSITEADIKMKYSNLTSKSNHLVKFKKLFIEAHKKNEINWMTDFVLTRPEREFVSNRNINQFIDDSNKDRKVIDGNEFMNKFNYFDDTMNTIVPLLLLASGRRVIELCLLGEFTENKDDAMSCFYSNFAKKGDELQKKEVIRLLIPWKTFKKNFDLMRAYYKTEKELTNEAFASKYNSSIYKYSQDLFGVNSHALRAIYGTICINNPNETDRDIIHFKNLLNHESLDSSVHYMKYGLSKKVDFDIVAGIDEMKI